MADTGRRTRPGWGVLVALLTLAGVVRVGIGLNSALDPDESQHLHAAWQVGQGQVPFRDFWEHHAPLFYYAMAPLTRWFAETPAVYLIGRALMSLMAVAAVALTYRLARRVSRGAAMAAIVLLALLPQFAKNSTEIRPDVPALVAWLLTLLALVNWRERGASRWLWASGLALGLDLALTLKAAYGGLGVAAAVAVAGPPRGFEGPQRRVLRVVGLLAAASVVPAALLGWLWLTGGRPALVGFLEQVVVQSARFADFSKTGPAPSGEEGFLVLALAGIGVVVWQHRASALREPIHAMLLPSLAVTSALLLLPQTPAVYQQAWLPTLPIAAVYGGLTLAMLLDGAKRQGAGWRTLFAMVAVVGGIIAPAAGSVYNAVRDQNETQFQVIRLELLQACPGEPVLDGTALAVFRPAAYRYQVLVKGIREGIAHGAIPEEQIEADLRRARARVGFLDKRLRALVGPVAAFLKRYYVATADGLLTAGASIVVSGEPTGSRASVDLLAPGPYRLVADHGVAVAIDGVRVRPGWVELGPGVHDVAGSGASGTITLMAATCPERRALAGRSNSLTVLGRGD